MRTLAPLHDPLSIRYSTEQSSFILSCARLKNTHQGIFESVGVRNLQQISEDTFVILEINSLFLQHFQLYSSNFPRTLSIKAELIVSKPEGKTYQKQIVAYPGRIVKENKLIFKLTNIVNSKFNCTGSPIQLLQIKLGEEVICQLESSVDLLSPLVLTTLNHSFLQIEIKQNSEWHVTETATPIEIFSLGYFDGNFGRPLLPSDSYQGLLSKTNLKDVIILTLPTINKVSSTEEVPAADESFVIDETSFEKEVDLNESASVKLTRDQTFPELETEPESPLSPPYKKFKNSEEETFCFSPTCEEGDNCFSNHEKMDNCFSSSPFNYNKEQLDWL